MSVSPAREYQGSVLHNHCGCVETISMTPGHGVSMPINPHHPPLESADGPPDANGVHTDRRDQWRRKPNPSLSDSAIQDAHILIDFTTITILPESPLPLGDPRYQTLR
jgi:hypothetical protein